MRPSLLAALLLSLWLSPSAQAGTFNYWVATFTWAPEFCNRHLTTKAPLCREANGFVVTGLRSHVSGPEPQCEAGAKVEPALVDRMMPIVKNADLIQIAWYEGGACSGLPRNEYFLQLDRVGRRLAVPSDLALVKRKDLDLTAESLRARLASVNEGLSPDAVRLSCRDRSRYVEAVHVCLDQNFEFRSCGLDLQDDCDRTDLRLRRLPPRLAD